MRTEQVEIYSDASNLAVMRHPGRRFPGVLMQGDTLHVLCTRLDALCATARTQLSANDYAELNDLRNGLHDRLNHYKSVLGEHGLPLPF